MKNRVHQEDQLQRCRCQEATLRLRTRTMETNQLELGHRHTREQSDLIECQPLYLMRYHEPLPKPSLAQVIIAVQDLATGGSCCSFSCDELDVGFSRIFSHIRPKLKTFPVPRLTALAQGTPHRARRAQGIGRRTQTLYMHVYAHGCTHVHTPACATGLYT